jgi:hypothetical protein
MERKRKRTRDQNGGRKRTPKEADDARADAGKTTREGMRYGLPQYSQARSLYTHTLLGQQGVRFCQSEDDPRLWGAFATHDRLKELIPEGGDVVIIEDRRTGEQIELDVDEASVITRSYHMLVTRA